MGPNFAKTIDVGNGLSNRKNLSFLIGLSIYALTPVASFGLDCDEIYRTLSTRFEEIREDGNPDELRRIERTMARIQARSERSYWSGRKSYKDQADIAAALKTGELKEIPELDGIKRSANMTLAYVNDELLTGILIVRDEFFRKLDELQYPRDRIALMLSSTIRTEELQRDLSRQGYPAATRSSHTYGLAFDISVQGFNHYNPEVSNILKEVLLGLQREGKINFIDEQRQQVFHVAISPNYFRPTE